MYGSDLQTKLDQTSKKNRIRIWPSKINEFRAYLILPDLSLCSFALKVNKIDILILYYHFDQQILQEKFNWLQRLDLDVQAGSYQVLKTGSESHYILKTGSGPDQQPYQLESKLQMPVPNSYDGKLQQLQKEIDSRLDDNTPAGF